MGPHHQVYMGHVLKVIWNCNGYGDGNIAPGNQSCFEKKGSLICSARV
jgi:hypothetical protein